MTFYQVLSQYYESIFPSNPTQIEFMKKIISKDNCEILDMAAGAGNQAIELAKLNHRVTAVDLDAEMVKKIQQKKQEGIENITAKVMDMRNVHQFNPASFDVVICIGNSIVHLDSLQEIKQVCKNVYNTLKSSGSFIIQVVNYDRILQQNITRLPLIERKEEGLTFERTYTYQEKEHKILFTGKLTVVQNGHKEVYNNSVPLYPLTSNELKEALNEAGFDNIQLFGDFKGNDYTQDASPLIAVAKK